MMGSSSFYLPMIVRSTLTLVFVLFFGVTISGQNNAPRIAVGERVSAEIAADQVRTYTLHLEANQYAEIFLEQKGVNVALALEEATASRQRLLTIDQNPQKFGGERLFFENGNAARDLLLRVFLTDTTEKGGFSLSLAALKKTEERDKLRLAAQAAVSEGLPLTEKDNAPAIEKGRVILENALKLARAGNDQNLETDILILLQSSYMTSGDKQKSLDYGKSALALLANRQNSYEYAKAKTLLGQNQISMGDIAAGIETLSQSLERARKFGDRSMEISILIRIGVGYQRLGNAAKCLEYIEQALELAKKIDSIFYQSEAARIISRVHYSRGDFLRAIETLNRVLNIAADTEPTLKYAIYSELATNYIFLGQRQKALDYLRQALVFYRDVTGNKWNEAATLQNIAQLYTSLGQNSRALEFNRQASEIYTKFNYKDAMIGAARTQAVIYRNAKNYIKEKESVLESLKISESGGDKYLTAALYASLGAVEKRLGRYDSALAAYQKAVEINGALNIKAARSAYLIPVSELYLLLDQPEKAGQSAAQALETASAVGDRITESNALYYLARVEQTRKNLNESLRLVESSLKIIESLRAEIISPESRTAYFSTVRDKYDFYIELLLDLENRTGDKIFAARAFAASERARARNLLDLLAESYTNVTGGISPELKSREQEIEAKLSSLQTQMIRQRSVPVTNSVLIAELQKEISKADEAREQLESEIRRDNPRYAALKYPTTLDLAQTQSLLDEKTVLLTYQIGANASFVFAVGKRDFQVVRLPDEKSLREAVEVLRRSISSPARTEFANYLVTGSALYKKLLAPIENLLQTKNKILISADGALNYLPFEILLTGAAQTNLNKLLYLLHNFEISYIPSASVLANLKNSEKTGVRQSKPPKSFLAFAAPDYRANAGGDSSENNQTRSFVPQERQWNLSELRYARSEAESIAALFPAGQATVFTGAEATESRAESNELLGQYRYLHFAVHGLVDEDQPQFSGLVLSLPKTAEKPQTLDSLTQVPEDGLLQTPEIFNLRLRTDLVTLSACETGLGQELRGEGIVGLTRAFFYAGASSVMVSLWKVDDASTAQLMRHFYENLRSGGERDKAAALRRAKLKLIEESRFTHPYYWAAFVLQGKTEGTGK